MGVAVARPNVGLSSRTGCRQKKNPYARKEWKDAALLPKHLFILNCSKSHLKKKMTQKTKWNCVRSKPDASNTIF